MKKGWQAWGDVTAAEADVVADIVCIEKNLYLCTMGQINIFLFLDAYYSYSDPLCGGLVHSPYITITIVYLYHGTALRL